MLKSPSFIQRQTLLWVLLVAAATSWNLGCDSKKHAAEARRAQREHAVRPPSPKPEETTASIQFKEAGHLKDGFFVATKKGIVICEGCSYPGGGKFELLERSGRRDLGVQIPVDLFDATYGKDFSRMKQRFPYGGRLELWPTSREELVLRMHAVYDDDDEPRTGVEFFEHFYRFQNGKWERADQLAVEPDDARAHLPSHPRHYDLPFSQAPYGSGATFAAGGGGPIMAVDNYAVRLYDESSARWGEERRIPWFGDQPTAIRLRDGRTLVARNAIGILDEEGRATRIPFEFKKAGDVLSWIHVGDEVWLETTQGTEKRFFVPSPPLEFSRLPPREPFLSIGWIERLSDARRQLDPAVGHSRTSAESSTESDPPWYSGPDARPFTEECRTPFVLLSTPPRASWNYDTTARLLMNLDTGPLRFFEVSKRETTYFGAQAVSKSDADALMAHFKEQVPASRPLLHCWDIASKVTDRYAPPPGILEILFNLTSGEQYQFLH